MNSPYKINIEKIKEAINSGETGRLKDVINELYAADLAEIMDELTLEEAKYFYKLLDKEEAAEVLMELDEDVRERFLASFSTQEIAQEFIDNLESDDAADLIGELPDTRREEVMAQIEDRQQAQDIADLLVYHPNSAGGLMAKELVKVNSNWHVVTCIREMRKQAEDLDNVYAVYVVDERGVLVGLLPLEKLLFASPRDLIEKWYTSDFISVKASQKGEDVARVMNKYNLIALPVVDEIGRLVGRITIDDVVDFIKGEAERDYQLLSGVTEDLEHTDKIWQLTRGRLFWLVVALFGGIFGSMVVENYEGQISINPELAFFMPLILAMAGNVGVQSSALIVQGLANHTLTGGILPKLFKELSVGLLNGLACSVILLTYSLLFLPKISLALTVSVSLLTVVVFASVFGSFVPLALNRLKIDPALATGPFITTSNDIIGLFIYFMIGRIIYGMF